MTMSAVSNKPAQMANTKHNWNKYSRADIEVLQIAWSALETAY